MKHWTSTNIFGSYMRIFNRKVSNVFLRRDWIENSCSYFAMTSCSALWVSQEGSVFLFKFFTLFHVFFHQFSSFYPVSRYKSKRQYRVYEATFLQFVVNLVSKGGKKTQQVKSASILWEFPGRSCQLFKKTGQPITWEGRRAWGNPN